MDSVLVRKTLDLYAGFGWKSIFAKIRFWDAPFTPVEKLVPREGMIVDLGCGEGIFTNFLGLNSRKRKVLGIDVDRKRLKIADRGVPNVSFRWGDATRVNFPIADTIILFHLLHHLNSYNEQEKVLSICFNQLKSEGKLIIVEAEPKVSLKFLLTWATDHFLVPWIFERRIYSPIFFRSSGEWSKIIKKNGFTCRIIPAETGHPFTHIILLCQKI